MINEHETLKKAMVVCFLCHVCEQQGHACAQRHKGEAGCRSVMEVEGGGGSGGRRRRKLRTHTKRRGAQRAKSEAKSCSEIEFVFAPSIVSITIQFSTRRNFFFCFIRLSVVISRFVIPLNPVDTTLNTSVNHQPRLFTKIILMTGSH
jgi:hypothetical protein